MADRKVLVFPSLLFVSFLLATVSTEYRFNGFRGSFVPNNNHQNSVTTSTSTNNVQSNNFYNKYNNDNNYNKPAENHVETDNHINNRRCVQKSTTDFRPAPGSCSHFLMCSSGVLITFSCPDSTVFNGEVKSCVPKGSRFDTCEEAETNVPGVFTPGVRPQPVSQLTTLCPRGATYKKAHPVHCARYYDCSMPAMVSRWEDHEWECKYPFLFNEDTKRCEHYSMVSCGTRKIAYDKCDYKQYSCNGHSHCRPCNVQHPSCRDLPDGMNVWLGRVPSPYYVVCSDHRVVYSGSCPNGQLFDAKTGTCVIQQNNYTWG